MRVLNFIGRKIIDNIETITELQGMKIKIGDDYVEVQQPDEEILDGNNRKIIRRIVDINFNKQKIILYIRYLKHIYRDGNTSPYRYIVSLDMADDKIISVLSEIITDNSPVQFYREYEGKKLNKRFESLAYDQGYNASWNSNANVVNIWNMRDAIDGQYTSRKLDVELFITVSDHLEIMRIIPAVKESIHFSWQFIDEDVAINDDVIRRCLDCLTQKTKRRKVLQIFDTWQCTYYIVYGKNEASEPAEIDVACTPEEYKLLHILSEAQSGNISEYYTEKQLEKYEDLAVEDIAELEDFAERVREKAIEAAYIDLKNVSDKEVERLDTGAYQVRWGYGNVE